MTPQERDLINALLARLQQQGGRPRDPEADMLIRQGTAQLPDALYLLVQTVLIQDMALHEAQNRIAELERARGDQTNASSSGAAPSFLPPTPSQAAPAPAQGSVPSAGPWGAAAPEPPQPREPVWTQRYAAPPPNAAPPAAPPAYGYGGGYGPQMLAGSGSGFLRQAAATAAGVVGGSLLFQGLHSMFAPSYGSGFLSGMPMQPGLSETVVNNYYNDPGAQQTGADAGAAPDPSGGYTDAQDVTTDPGQDYGDNDPGFDPSGGDFGGDDGGNYDV